LSFSPSASHWLLSLMARPVHGGNT
jgi:hypothetical protein